MNWKQLGKYAYILAGVLPWLLMIVLLAFPLWVVRGRDTENLSGLEYMSAGVWRFVTVAWVWVLYSAA